MNIRLVRAVFLFVPGWPGRSSGQEIEDVLYDMGRDYDVMNRQREGVVGAGIIKR
jgi:hypothetical protein